MRKLLVLIMAISFWSSCKREDDDISETRYLPLRIGNYWIYQEFRIDTSGNETASTKLDSIIIKRDSIINNKKYFVLEGIFYPFNSGKWDVHDILRDSSGYIVNQNGIVKFAQNNFTDILNFHVVTNLEDGDTLVRESYKMEKSNNNITVPAGIFEVLNYKGTITTTMNTPGIKYPRYVNMYYAEGVGKILFTYFYINSPDIYEKRLIRYHLEK